MTYRGTREVTASQDAVKNTQLTDWKIASATMTPRTMVIIPSVGELNRLALIQPGTPTVIAGGAGFGLVEGVFISTSSTDSCVSGHSVVDVAYEGIEEAHGEVCDHDHADERDGGCDLGHGGGYADEVGVSDGGGEAGVLSEVQVLADHRRDYDAQGLWEYDVAE